MAGDRFFLAAETRCCAATAGASRSGFNRSPHPIEAEIRGSVKNVVDCLETADLRATSGGNSHTICPPN